jgi:molybdopterin-guanine dinucleotide biosynthesis protein A
VTSSNDDKRIAGITALILAGGLNTRFSGPKGLIRINDTPIIESNLSVMRSVFKDVLISTNSPEIYFRFGARMLGDVLPSRGPMSGIYTALLNAADEAVFVMACDMPFPDAGLIRLICERHAGWPGPDHLDATIPVGNGKPQPLFGVYGKSLMRALEESVFQDRVMLARFLDERRTQYIDETDVRAVDPECRSFININTPGEYEAIIGNQVPEHRQNPSG